MKEHSEILQEILNLAKSELNENGNIGYTMPDGKYHIYIYVDDSIKYAENSKTAEDGYYVIEPNRVIDGAMEPLGDTATAEYNDFAELLVGCVWCMEEFERDVERKKEIELKKDELECVSETKDFEMLKAQLNIESLRLIDNIYHDYNRGRIDLDVPRDENGNFNFEDVKLFFKDPYYEETGFELVVLKWLEDMEDTGYLIECFKDVQQDLKTYEYVVDYLNPFTCKRCSFEFSCVGEDYPSGEWLANRIYENLSVSFAAGNFRKAVASIDCIGLQVTQNGEYVSGDELTGAELQDVLKKVICFIQNKQASIDEQISVAQEITGNVSDSIQKKNQEIYK